MVGEAVNVTDVPAQTAPEGLAPILTEGVTLGLTVIVIWLDVAVTGLAQVAFDTSTHFITSLFTNALLAHVELVPTLVPFLYQVYAGVPPLPGVGVKVTLVPGQIAPTGDAAI